MSSDGSTNSDTLLFCDFLTRWPTVARNNSRYGRAPIFDACRNAGRLCRDKHMLPLAKARRTAASIGGILWRTSQIIAQGDDAHTVIFAKRQQSTIPCDNRLRPTGECALQNAIVRLILDHV